MNESYVYRLIKQINKYDLSLRKLALLIYYLFLFSEFHLSYISVGPSPLRNYFSLSLAILMTTIALKEKVQIRKYDFLIISSFPLLIFISFFLEIPRGNLLSEGAIFFIKPFLKYTPIIISSYLMGRVFSLETISKAIIFSMLPNSILSIFQGLGADWAWNLRSTLDGENLDLFMSRPLGLSYYYIQLAEQLLLSTSLALAISIKRGKPFSYIIFFLLFSSILFNHTRSVFISMTLLTLFLLFIPNRGKVLLKVSFIFFAALFFYSTPINLSKGNKLSHFSSKYSDYEISKTSQRSFSLDVSLGTRVYLHIAAIKLFLETAPLGMGSRVSKDFNRMAKKHIKDLGIPGYEESKNTSPHSFYLNFLLKHSLLGLLVLFLIYGMTFLKILSLNEKLMQIILSAPVLAFSINSSVHNAGLLNSIMFCFVFFAILGTTERIHYESSKDLKTENI